MYSNNKTNERPTIGFFLDRLFDPYNYHCWKNVIAAAEEQDVNLICFSGGVLKNPRFFHIHRNAIYKLASPRNVDGILSLSGAVGNNALAQEVDSFYKLFSTLPLISLGVKMPGYPSIVTDNHNSMFRLTSHLIEVHGRKKIAFITGPQESEEASERLAGYKKALREHDLQQDPALIVQGHFYREDGRNAVIELLDRRKATFDALIGANDIMAIYAIFELQRRGFRIPEEISLAGFDNIEEAENLSLTTLEQPFKELTSKGVKSITELLQGRPIPEFQNLNTLFVKRRSCGCSSLKPEKSLPAFDENFTLMNDRQIFTAEVNEDLIGSFDKEYIKEFLQSQLPNLGIEHCYIALYEKNPVYAKLFWSLNDKHFSPNPFPVEEILPGGIKNLKQRFSFILIPLYFKEDQLGYILFQNNPANRYLYETFGGQLSAVLEGARMKEKLEAYASGLEKKIFTLLHNQLGHNSENRSDQELFSKRCLEYKLTNRQKSVLEYVLEGLTYKEISTQLHIGLKAVEYHVKNIYQKCGVKNKYKLFNIFQP